MFNNADIKQVIRENGMGFLKVSVIVGFLFLETNEGCGKPFSGKLKEDDCRSIVISHELSCILTGMFINNFK